jgi:hypothetical protein
MPDRPPIGDRPNTARRQPAPRRTALRRIALPGSALRYVVLVLTLAYATLLAGAVLASSTGLAAVASPEPSSTSAAIAASLSPDRPGAKSTLTFTIHYSGDESSGVPAPVRRTLLSFPAGLTLDIPRLSACSAPRLRARGPSACSRQSELGVGHALVLAPLGSQTITEPISLSIFLGVPQNLQPTVEILGQGLTPFDQRVLLSGATLSGQAPYGEQLEMSIPPIPTLPLEPDASMASISLAIGARARAGTRGANAVIVPSHCPKGGFPFAGEFTYANGSVGIATTRIPCPTG